MGRRNNNRRASASADQSSDKVENPGLYLIDLILGKTDFDSSSFRMDDPPPFQWAVGKEHILMRAAEMNIRHVFEYPIQVLMRMSYQELKVLRGLLVDDSAAEADEAAEDAIDDLSTIASSAPGGSASSTVDGAGLVDDGDGEDENELSRDSLDRRRTAAAVAPERDARGMTTLTLPPTVPRVSVVGLSKDMIVEKYTEAMLILHDDTTLSPERRAIMVKSLEVKQSIDLAKFDKAEERRNAEKRARSRIIARMLEKDIAKAMKLLSQHLGMNPKSLIAEELGRRRVYDAWIKLDNEYSGDISKQGPTILKTLTHYRIQPSQSLRDFERGLRLLFKLYAAVRRGADMSEDEKLVYLFSGLEHDNRYRRTIEFCQESDFDFAESANRLRKKERHRELQRIVDNGVAAANGRNGGKGSKSGGSEDTVKEANATAADQSKSKGDNKSGGKSYGSSGKGGRPKRTMWTCFECGEYTDHKADSCPKKKSDKSPLTAADIHSRYKKMEKTANHATGDRRRVRFPTDDDCVDCGHCFAAAVLDGDESSVDEYDALSDHDGNSLSLSDGEESGSNDFVVVHGGVTEAVDVSDGFEQFPLPASVMLPDLPSSLSDLGAGDVIGELPSPVVPLSRELFGLQPSLDCSLLSVRDDLSSRQDTNVAVNCSLYMPFVAVIDDCVSVVETACESELALADWLVKLLSSLTLTTIHDPDGDGSQGDGVEQFYAIDSAMLASFSACDMSVSVAMADVFASCEHAVIDNATIRAASPMLQAGIANVFLTVGQYLAAVSDEIHEYLEEMHLSRTVALEVMASRRDAHRRRRVFVDDHADTDTIIEADCGVVESNHGDKSCAKRKQYVLDSAVNAHMLNSSDGLEDVCPDSTKVRLGGSEKIVIRATHVGQSRGYLTDVLVVPQLGRNLISATLLQRDGFHILMISSGCTYVVSASGLVISRGMTGEDNLIRMSDRNLIDGGDLGVIVDVDALRAALGGLDAFPLGAESHHTSKVSAVFGKGSAVNRPRRMLDGVSVQEMLHNALGHVATDTILRGIKHGTWKDVSSDTADMIKSENMLCCEACEMAKSKKLPVGESDTDNSHLLPWEKVVSDIVGKMNVRSHDGKWYFILYMDAVTRKVKVPVISVQSKSDLYDSTVDFVEELEKKGYFVKILQSDSDVLYLDKRVKRFCKSKGITLQRSVPHSHEQNGMAERMIQTLLTMARAMMLSSGAPQNVWEYAIDTAAYIWNVLPNKNLEGNISPYEAATGEKPRIAHMVPFYAKGYYHLDPSERKKSAKFRARALPVHFLGYPDGYKNAYRVIDENGRVLIRRDVIFDEHMAVGANNGAGLKLSVGDDEDEEQAVDSEDENAGAAAASQASDVKGEESESVDLVPSEPRRNPPRQARRVGEYVDSCFTVCVDDLPEDVRSINPDTPKNVHEALDLSNPFREYWLKAINDEVQALLDRDVVKVVPPEIAQHVKQVFRSFMVFRFVKLPDRTYKFKARLVGDGRSQVQGINFDDTQSPTAGFHVVLILFHVAAIKCYHITGCDIANAYVEALADHELYMYLPFDYTGGTKVMVQLLRNLYGTKQAARLWYAKIDEVLREYGLQRSNVEPCLYYRRDEDFVLYVLIYVDDVLIVGSTKKVAECFKEYLSKTFTKITDLGEVHRYLGIDIKREGDYFVFNQADYIEKMLDKFDINPEHKGKSTPLPVSVDVMRAGRKDGEPVITIHDRVGSYRFAADRTHPEVSFSASFLGSFAANATEEHVKACDRGFGYLNRVKSLGQRMGGPSRIFKPVAYVDASFVCDGDSKSQLGIAIFLSPEAGAIIWKSMKDKTVSTSSTHSETNAATECVKFILWLRALCEDFGEPQSEPTVMMMDNANVRQLTERIGSESRSKFLVNRINFLKEAIENGDVKIVYVPTEDNVADIFTKSLPRHVFERLRFKLLNGYAMEPEDLEALLDGIDA